MKATLTHTGHEATAEPAVLGPADIEHMPWQTVTHHPGVRVKELWRSDDLVHALIVVAPGARTPGEPHPTATHHIWVLSGEASIAGRQVAEGSYVYVPAGVPHPIIGVGPQGCALLQAHRIARSGPAPAGTAR